MDNKERRAKGAHYTSEENIRRVLDPLFSMLSAPNSPNSAPTPAQRRHSNNSTTALPPSASLILPAAAAISS
jgi:hypothetical protein